MVLSEEEIEDLKRERDEAISKFQKIAAIWEKAFGEFRAVRENLESEIEEHQETKQRLANQQRLLETLTKVASAGLEEYNILKQDYARECALRKQYEERLDALSSTPTTPIRSEPSQEAKDSILLSESISNVYLIPTLTELGERLERAEQELSMANQRALTAERNLERIQNAASNAMEEFQQLKERYNLEMARRQEAEKLAMQYKIDLENASALTVIKVTPPPGKEEQLQKALDTEKALRKLAENDVNVLSKQLNEKRGKQFDLMLVTELECQLEASTKSLKVSQTRVETLEKENAELQAQLEDLQKRTGSSSLPAPPPPPPPPLFTTVHAQDNLKKKIGVLKNKLQGDSQDDKLGDLRAQAMVELQKKLQKRSQMQREHEKSTETSTEKMENLATVLQRSREDTVTGSKRKVKQVNDSLDGLEKQVKGLSN